MRFVDAAAVASLGPAAAVQAITGALRGGLDPAADPARASVDLDHGQFLLMPSRAAGAAGVKVVTVAPENPSRGLPRIQAAYLLFDSDTLALRAILDGTALTALRTPAVSVAAVRGRLPDRAVKVAVIGAGPQAVGHVSTLAAVHPIHDATYLVRDPSRTPLDAMALGSREADQTLQWADVVVCATSARSPVFDSALLRNDAVVIAVGSHEPDARELDSALMGRAGVVVEDVRTALREAGDVVQAVADGTLDPAKLLAMRDVVTGATEVPTDRPLVFKSVGMSWQDLVVATAVLQHISGASPSTGLRTYYQGMASRSHFTPDEARAAGERIGVDWASAPFDLEQFRMGMDVELEHGTRDAQTNVTDDDALTTAKIARAHLNEFPDYYTRLARMEAEAEGKPKGTTQGE